MSKVNLAVQNARIEKMRDLLSKGHNLTSISKVMGIALPNVSTFVRRHGLVTGKLKPGRAPGTCARPEVLARIKPLIEQGILPTEVSNRTGIRVDTIRHYARRYCKRAYLKVRNHACASNARPAWGTETADPAILTPEQLDTARRVGITPERFAWLCSIPKDLDRKVGAIGHRGGNTIG